jgi:hypothetical protein
MATDPEEPKNAQKRVVLKNYSVATLYLLFFSLFLNLLGAKKISPVICHFHFFLDLERWMRIPVGVYTYADSKHWRNSQNK